MSADETKHLIVDAASKRFSLYGYKKTTMAEIAQDCRMSAANLYRYYRNKQDIGAALARECLNDRYHRLREVVSRPGLPASKRLEEYMLTILRHTHELSNDQPKINELVDEVISGHSDIVEKTKAQEQALLTEILAEGNRNEEFEVDDVIATASTIQTASTMFCTPMFMFMHSLSELETMALNVARLLIQGLAKR